MKKLIFLLILFFGTNGYSAYKQLEVLYQYDTNENLELFKTFVDSEIAKPTTTRAINEGVVDPNIGVEYSTSANLSPIMPNYLHFTIFYTTASSESDTAYKNFFKDIKDEMQKDCVAVGSYIRVIDGYHDEKKPIKLKEIIKK